MYLWIKCTGVCILRVFEDYLTILLLDCKKYARTPLSANTKEEDLVQNDKFKPR